ncbi:transposase, partial [Desulfocurvus sp. DL9XJH121]
RLMAAQRCRLATLEPIAAPHARALVQIISGQLDQLNKHITRLVEACEPIARNNALLCQIKGIGPLTATMLQGLMPELGQVGGKQIAALAGLAPYNRDSGNRRGARCIWGGRERVRRALWMAAVCASTYNPQYRSLYRRLTDKGKPTKVALTAVMRKILIHCNAIVRDQNMKTNDIRA